MKRKSSADHIWIADSRLLQLIACMVSMLVGDASRLRSAGLKGQKCLPPSYNWNPICVCTEGPEVHHAFPCYSGTDLKKWRSE